MRLASILAPIAAATLASAPVAAQAIERQAAPVEQENALNGSSATIPIIAGLILVGVTFLIAESMDDDDDDDAISV